MQVLSVTSVGHNQHLDTQS